MGFMGVIVSVLNDLIAQAKKVELPKSDPVLVTVGDKLVELVFTRMAGTDWAELTSAHPMRTGVGIDSMYGYNFDTASVDAAKRSGAVTIYGEPVEMIVDARVKPPVDDWADLIGVLSGPDIQQIVDTIWTLNEWAPQQLTVALKKASAAKSLKQHDSPAPSVSPSNGSTGGSQQKRRSTSTTKKAG